MKAKLAVLFCVIMTITLVKSSISSYAIETLSKQKLPYEILKIEVQDRNLIIKGWAFLNAKQHFLDESTHSYQIIAKSATQEQVFSGRQLTGSQTENMKYGTVRACQATEFQQDAAVCYYNYENVGFEFKIPLLNFEVGETYQFDLIVEGKLIKQSYKIPIYYPLPNDLIFTLNNLNYQVISRLEDSNITVTHEMVIVREGTTKTSKQQKGTISCGASYGSYLYYLNGTTFKHVLERKVVGENTYYRVSGQQTSCLAGKLQMIEGTSVSPAWILSNFIDYSGIPLRLSINYDVSQITYRFIDYNAVLNDPLIPALWSKEQLIQLFKADQIIFSTRLD